MKNKTKVMATFTAVIAVVAMSSCKKEKLENPVTPEQETSIVSTRSELQRGGTILLSSVGNKTLTYAPNKKLSSVNYGNGSIKTYTYSSQLNVIIVTDKYNGVRTNEITYFLNASGLATKMAYKAFSAQGNVFIDAEYQLTYTNGKLTEQKATKGFSDKYKFIYDAKGRLQWLETYKSDGTLLDKMNYLYGDSFNQAEIADKNLINPRETFLDDHLKIFGVFSNDLLRIQKYYKGALFTQHQFVYQVNNNGYPTERKEMNMLTMAAPIETLSYGYTTGF